MKANKNSKRTPAMVVDGDRIITTRPNGEFICVTKDGGVIALPSEFATTLQALRADLDLALECIEVFHGIPIPVAKAIQRNLEPAQAALDLALKSGEAGR
jgi:hypothetical protein